MFVYRVTFLLCLLWVIDQVYQCVESSTRCTNVLSHRPGVSMCTSTFIKEIWRTSLICCADARFRHFKLSKITSSYYYIIIKRTTELDNNIATAIQRWPARNQHDPQPFNPLMGTGNYSAHRIIWSWYTGRWWMGCYIWYSDEEPRRAISSFAL